MTTEQPYVTFEATTLNLPQDFSTNDFELVDSKKAESLVGAQIEVPFDKDSQKVQENPF